MQDHLLKKIIKNSGIIFCGDSMASVLNIISFALMARAIGPELLAIFVLSQTYALLINDIFNIQTWESMVKFGSQQVGSDDFSNIIKTNLLLDIVSAVIAFLLSLLLIHPIFVLFGWDLSNIFIISLYTSSILFNITSLTVGIPRLFNKFSSIAKIQVVMAIIRFFSILVVFFCTNKLIYYLSIYLVMEISTNILLIFFSIKLLRSKLGNEWWRRKMRLDREHLRFIWWTNLRTIVRIPVRRFDVIVISSVMSLQMLGFYKVYKEIAGIISRIGEPVNQSIYPEFTKLIEKNDSQRSIMIAKKTIILMSGVSFVLTTALLLTANFIISYFFGHEYLEHIWALYLMIIISGVSFSISPINSLFIAAGFAKLSFYIVIFTNTIYLAVAFMCGTIWGVYGVILANAIQMLLNQSLKIILMKKYPTGWSGSVR